MATEELAQYVDVRQLCNAMRMSRSTIYQACKRGDLPRGIRIGRAHRWSVNEIKEWLKQKGAENYE